MSTTMQVNKAMSPFEWGMLLALSVLWGGSFFFNGIAVRELPTFTVVVARVVLAAVILFVVMGIVGQKMPWNYRIWTAFLVMGLLNNVIPFTLIVWGQSHIASGVASILNATTPLFTVVVAHVFTSDEKMTAGRLLGVLVGLVGVAMMIGGDALGDLIVVDFGAVGLRKPSVDDRVDPSVQAIHHSLGVYAVGGGVFAELPYFVAYCGQFVHVERRA